MDRPDAQLIQRFADDLAALWPAFAERKLGVAVSGGADSLALLILANAAMPGRIEAATVDHGLRSESADEAEFVKNICRDIQVRHATVRVVVADGNIQSQARNARYAALAGWLADRNLDALATGHHADDQAETLLLRLNRGSGVAGLAGVRPRGIVPDTAIPLLRPVLGWRRAELADVVAAAGLAAINDPSNHNDRFDRARLRKSMAEAKWLDVPAMATSAAHIADADAALDWAARREWAEAVTAEGLGLLYRPQAPRAVALRVLSRIVRELNGEDARGGAIARVFDALIAGQIASIGNLVARSTHSGWSFSKAPKRRN